MPRFAIVSSSPNPRSSQQCTKLSIFHSGGKAFVFLDMERHAGDCSRVFGIDIPDAYVYSNSNME